MGLSAPKNRSRISNDPQNTTWANNTTRFGHRILTSQGWTPGASLGATDAAHSAHYTAASHSHIRVLLKDDNLGLGAKRGSERAENFGLAGLESVLGRLNGKIEEVKKEEERREKIEQRAYVYQKFGFMNFVSGGFLVGDKIEKRVKKEVEVKVEIKSEPESSESEAQEKNKLKKRKRSGEDEDIKHKEQVEEQPKLKRKKKSMNLREESTRENAAPESTSTSKKGKKDRKSKKSTDTTATATDTPTPTSEPLSEKARRKAEKRARKEEKKLKKALKRAAKEAARSNPATEDTSSESEEEEDTTPASSVPATGTSTPASGASGLIYPRGMHAVRQRYIRQKKMASMDPQALKEIFMIKTPS